MRISFTPQYSTEKLEVTKHGDLLTINGDPFDLSPLVEGESIPGRAFDCRFIADVHPITRTNGEIHITLIVPCNENPSPHVSFPTDLVDVPDGIVPVPFDPEPEPGVEVIDDEN